VKFDYGGLIVIMIVICDSLEMEFLCMLMKVWFNGEDEYDFFLCFGCE
jgi:hypothetical protein